MPSAPADTVSTGLKVRLPSAGAGKRGAQPMRKIRITATVPDDVYQELLRGTRKRSKR